jgi:transposase
VRTRWLGQFETPRKAAEGAPPEPSWRAWLATGARSGPIDRRRGRGSDARLKNILLGKPSGAVDFSSAMARQSVDEGMSELPSEHRQVLKLAYFAGLTNREIATHLGLSVGAVRRRLRESVRIVGEYVERGRAAGRRAVHGVVVLVARPRGHAAQQWNGPALDQVLQAGAVAVMTLATAAIVLTHHSAIQPSHPHKAPHVAAVGSSAPLVRPGWDRTVAAVSVPLAPAANVVQQAGSATSLPVKIPAVRLPVRLPIHLPVPLPSL